MLFNVQPEGQTVVLVSEGGGAATLQSVITLIVLAQNMLNTLCSYKTFLGPALRVPIDSAMLTVTILKHCKCFIIKKKGVLKGVHELETSKVLGAGVQLHGICQRFAGSKTVALIPRRTGPQISNSLMQCKGDIPPIEQYLRLTYITPKEEGLAPDPVLPVAR